ncbi:alpha-ketoglutarate-dependent dioxygenase AlkB [Azoarcus communis]|uniref:alpha-ketoglutarate-dependent dioxygenase AlkB family protein n=1 Tax=Parazoarcus communis TaxID=41977 RepID=UPI001459BD02|nr:alpha-ketoglutarate-dependent dioxygenase AlkB [Parazoarcus communis]NMG46547.1 alpha-ketoglutarate-dependent dioxygenase AlkB [Parazoarcus communis]
MSATRPPASPPLQPVPGQPLLACASVLDPAAAQALFDVLLAETPWTEGHYIAAGRRFALPRLQCWFADAGVEYRYAQQLLNSHAWTPRLQALRSSVEACCGVSFNAVLANLYRDGDDHVSWHADDEDDLGPAPHIASLSLGATRYFHWRPKPGTPGDAGRLPLPPGLLLLMRAPFQQHWEHAIPTAPSVSGARLNLTFRQVIPTARV